jgi:hypothetical protein
MILLKNNEFRLLHSGQRERRAGVCIDRFLRGGGILPKLGADSHMHQAKMQDDFSNRPWTGSVQHNLKNCATADARPELIKSKSYTLSLMHMGQTPMPEYTGKRIFGSEAG